MEALDRFSVEEKEVLQRSWKVLDRNLNNTAYNIFEMIIQQSPDTKQLFPFIKINHTGRCREMEFHALRFMQVLESVVKTLDSPASLNPLCDNLGRVHGRLSESRGFRTHHWSVFIECTLFHFRKVLAQDSYFKMDVLDRVIVNWRTILRLLIKQMKKGFNTDIKNRAASRDVNDDALHEHHHHPNKASTSTSSSPVSDDSNCLAVPMNGNNMTQSLTLPVINMNYRKLSDARSTPGDDRPAPQATGILRPLKEFARRKFINHW